MKIIRALSFLLLSLPCSAQTTDADFFKALDSVDVVASLSEQVAELERAMEMENAGRYARRREQDRLAWNISALLRDTRFQFVVEEMERQKARPAELAGIEELRVADEPSAAFLTGPDALLNADTRAQARLPLLRGDIATVEDGKPTLIIEVNDTPFCAFQRRVALMDKSFSKQYPWVASQIKKGKIALVYRDEPGPIRLMALAAPMIVPVPPRRGATEVEKAQIAEDYAIFIRSFCENTKCLGSKVAHDYFRREGSWVRNGNLDKLIDTRKKFKEHLRNEKKKCNAQ